MECEYCKNKFKSIGNLKTHQKTAKYCKILQDTNNESIYICVYCDKKYTQSINLQKHLIICNKKNIIEYSNTEINKLHLEYKEIINNLHIDYKEKICKLELENEYLQKLYQDISEQHKYDIKRNEILTENYLNTIENITIKKVQLPTSVNKTHINNLENIDIKDFKNHTDNLTIEHIQKGIVGYAEYAYNYIFKNKIICVDPSRKRFKYKNEKGEIIIDIYLQKLLPDFFRSIKIKNNELMNSYLNDLQEKTTTDIWGYYLNKFNCQIEMIKTCIDGNKNDKTNEFINYLCNLCLTPIY